METTKQRIEYFDGLRGLAAIWVAILHFPIGSGIFLAGEISSRGYLGVDLFALISGFVVYLSFISKNKSVWQFYLDRFLRVYCVLLPAGLFFLITSHSSDPLLPSFFKFLLTMEHNAYLGIQNWTLGNELILYLLSPIFYFLLRFLNSKKCLMFVWVVTSMMFLTWFFFISTEKNKLDIWYEDGLILRFFRGSGFERMFFEYLLGLLTAHYFIFLKGSVRRRYATALLMLSISATALGTRLDGLAIILMAGYLFFSDTPDFFKVFLGSKPLQYLGKISFSIYVWHTVGGQIFWQLFHEDVATPDKTLILEILYLGLVIIFGSVSYLLFESCLYRMVRPANHLVA